MRSDAMGSALDPLLPLSRRIQYTLNFKVCAQTFINVVRKMWPLDAYSNHYRTRCKFKFESWHSSFQSSRSRLLKSLNAVTDLFH